MEAWKKHVRAKLFQRDLLQKDPFTGLFNTYSQLLEKCELREKVWEENQISISEKSSSDGQTLEVPFHVYLVLKEKEKVIEKLLQTVADLNTTMYLKEAELQYCHSQVSRYRQEAVSQACDNAALRDTLSECEFALEQQSKEMAALRSGQTALLQEMDEIRREKEELQERWLQEKIQEAHRVNLNNEAQERWHRFTRQLTRRLHKQNQPQCEIKEGQPDSLKESSEPPRAKDN
ncbi:autophagy-related protein 16 isoform X2 [Paramormyrops kingsleyae]|uniref:autophagy-related protein 16 isoform X2 n=1 Tax=Paramormyrops kingsleyae TaxID=1676925 RepID=UPI000CD5F485|nr:autophagy-related protein 16-1-like isoform X2 [Paramormyrops kingsleyae]